MDKVFAAVKNQSLQTTTLGSVRPSVGRRRRRRRRGMIQTGFIPTRCVQSYRAKRRDQTTTTTTKDGKSRGVVLTRQACTARGRKWSTTRAEASGDASEGTPKRSETSMGDQNASGGDGETLEEKKRAFWETFWETLDAQRGKAPFMKRNATTAVKATKETTKETTSRMRRFEIPEGSDTFWGRCTIGGLVLAIFMTLSAYSLTHWPTVRFVLTNPLIFLFDPSAPDAGARVEMIKEIARRLAKPMVRYLAAWCALRSRWRTMWIAFAISCGVPAVEFTL